MIDYSRLEPYQVEMLPEFLGCGYNSAFDIPIEECEMLRACGIKVPSWYDDVIRDRVSAWSLRVDSAVTRESDMLETLAQRLKEFIPESIVVSGSTVYWKCVPASSTESQNAFFLIRERRGLSSVLTDLHESERGPFREACVLSEFLFGFREDFPPSGGYWLDFATEQAVLTDEYVNGNFGRFELTSRWSPALKVFAARNGDALVINRVGEWGWWQAGSEDEIVYAGSGLRSLTSVLGGYFAKLGSTAASVANIGRMTIFDSHWRSNH